MSDSPAQAGAAPDPGARRDPSPPSFIRAFPCRACGAKLSFAPGTRTLECDFCGTANDIPEDDGRVEELDLEAYLKSLEDREEAFVAERLRCARCGAEQELPAHHFAAECAYCAAPVVSKDYAGRRIHPRSIVPFQVDRKRAQQEFRRWVAGLRLAPNELKRYAQSDAAMKGTYLPYWTYDCHTESDFRGERGEDHYEQQQVRTSKGVEMRRVVRTDWFPVEGRVERFHDDVLVPASRSLASSLRGAAMGWNLNGLVAYRPEYVSGYRGEAYEVSLREGYPAAKEVIDANIHSMIRARIGGDRQRVISVSTRYADVRFKHVLLPVWVSAYRFKDKTYRFLVNGQTGEVAGESPLSWFKVTWLVVGVLLFFLLAYLFSR
ncbi:MAG TPA: hypothetical protein VEC19_09685 [Usitatibacter sp.]|nr:hypothetical protein [Usitatibacter sp.]